MEEETKKKKNSKLGTWLKVLAFVAFNVGILVWTGLSELNKQEENQAAFSSIQVQWWFLLLAIVCLVITIGAQSAKFKLMLDKLSPGQPWKTAIRVHLYGRYYDNITPFAAGGQPFQIFYLKRCNVELGAAMSIPIFDFLTTQFAFILVAGITFLFGTSAMELVSVRVMAYIGIAFYSFVPALVILFTVAPKAVTKVIAFFMRGLEKIHMLKNPKKKEEKMYQTLVEYRQYLVALIKRPKLLLSSFGLAVLYQVSLMSIPFFVLIAFGGTSDFLSCFATTVFIYAAITIIPTPGNAGAAEGSFYMIFSALSTTGYLFWAMLCWRLLIYYSYIVMGVVVFVREHFERKKLATVVKEEPERKLENVGESK